MSLGRMGARWGRLGAGFGGSGSGSSGGGPFLLLFDAVSKLLLFNATDKLLITGNAPSAGYVPTYHILGF